jgi:hypothetical protein
MQGDSEERKEDNLMLQRGQSMNQSSFFGSSNNAGNSILSRNSVQQFSNIYSNPASSDPDSD